MREHLIKFKADIEAIEGQWNGDSPGKLEDQSAICSEILAKVKEIEVLLEELDNIE